MARFFPTFITISLLLGGRNKPYPAPQSGPRHTKFPTLASPGSIARDPKPTQNIATPAIEMCVEVNRLVSLPAIGLHTDTAIGHGVKIKADSRTP